MDGNPHRPGSAVFTASGDRHNHIGLYCGENDVIKARGAEVGVTVSLLLLPVSHSDIFPLTLY